jgi:2-oxo-3-hexenedioate decarboxylase
MNPQELLNHYDSGQCWPNPLDIGGKYHVSDAYQDALLVRSLRLARGEKPLGYKIGFTNRKIWDLYKVYAPMWGTVWDTTVSYSSHSEATLSLKNICQPRLEPEIVFGFRTTPRPNASLQDLFESLEWLAPGFEIVQSHRPNWKFTASETVADSGLHAKLAIGSKLLISDFAENSSDLIKQLSLAKAELYKGDQLVETGEGSNVLDSPLEALNYFINELRNCPGATDIQPGDVVTTGTWTDAWPLTAGETWRVKFSFQNAQLKLDLVA